MSIKSILCIFSGAEGELSAVHTALVLAKAYSARVQFLHLSPDPSAYVGLYGEGIIVSGEIILHGINTTHAPESVLEQLRLEKIGFVFQYHFLLPEFSALDNIMLPMRKLEKLTPTQMQTRANELLQYFGLESAGSRKPGQLSGGECQRVAIARAMANDPLFIMADEPSGNLDTKNADLVFSLFERLVIVLNLSELRLFYFMKNGDVMTFPIGIGQEGWQTPLGTTTIASKRQNPSWIPPASIREENPDLPDIVPPGPDNPLGAYALYLGWKKFLIHGTNRPYGIGKRSSHGCVRLPIRNSLSLHNHKINGLQKPVPFATNTTHSVVN